MIRKKITAFIETIRTRKNLFRTLLAFTFIFSSSLSLVHAQINTDRVMAIGKNALYFEDFVLSIQYFNQVIRSKPYMAEPYFFRAVAKLNLEDYEGAEADCSECISRNPFIVNAYQCRAMARQSLGKYNEAIEDYNKGLEFNPENRTNLVNRAIAATQAKDSLLAEKYYDVLLKTYANFSFAYMAKGNFYLEKGNNQAALGCLNKAIELDKTLTPAYASRGIVYYQEKEYKKALSDYETALKFEPDNTHFLVNRSLIRYHLNDFNGSLADLDKVINIDENNLMARYNRGLLRMQIGDNNRAITDFDRVIRLEPDNFFAIYNRAILREETGNLKGSIEDISRVLAEYPKFVPGYYMRSELRRRTRDMKGGEADFKLAMRLEEEHKKGVASSTKKGAGSTGSSSDKEEKEDEKTRTKSEKDINKFNRLMVADKEETKTKYESEIRGRVQDRNIQVDLLSNYVLTYYEPSEAVRIGATHNNSLLAFNQQSLLRRKLLSTNKEVSLSEDQISEHFRSIDLYSQLISTETQPDRLAQFYFGRAIDFMLVQDFSSSIEDLNQAIIADNQFAFAYFLRAVVRSKEMESKSVDDMASAKSSHKNSIDVFGKKMEGEKAKLTDKRFDRASLDYELIMRDYDRVIQLIPKFPFVYFNRANLCCLMKDYQTAVDNYTEAIRLSPDLGEAYFNRALIYIYLGENAKGTADLSKAGELGIVGAYNVIKRINQ